MSDNGIAKFVDLIRDMIKSELGKTDSTAVCKVVEKRREGAYDYVYDLYVEPDESNIIRGVQNASNSDINEGDYVYIYKINNQLNNCFILKKIGKIGASAYISILEDKISTLVTKDDFSTSITQTAEEINLKASRSDVESEISQTAEKITAQVVKKHDANGTEQTKTFGWDLTVEQGFIIYDVINGNRTDVVKADSTGLEINGKVTATSGYIGNGIAGFTIGSTAIFNGINSFYDSTHNGIYLGVDGIRLGPNFYVDNQGNVVAKTLKTIDRVEIKYNKTLTNLPIPTTGWVSTIQELGDVAGYYVWTRTTTYYTTYTSGVQDSDVKYSISRDGVSTLIKGTVANWTALGSIVNPQDGDGYIVTDASDDPNIGTKESEGILYTYSSTATPHWVYCGQVKGPKGDKGDSPYLIDVENDFDSIPCNNEGEPHYTPEQWVSETTHYVRPYYGPTIVSSFYFQSSGKTLPTSGYTVTYTTYNVPSGKYHAPNEGTISTPLTAYIDGIGDESNNASVEYNLYLGTSLLATSKFEATKQITGANAIDYSLSWSSSSFKKDPNTGVTTPTSIRVDVKESQRGVELVTNPSYCHYKYKYDNASVWITPSVETFPVTIQASQMVGHSSITIGVWVDLTKTGSGTYAFWESESINVMADGENSVNYSLVGMPVSFKKAQSGIYSPTEFTVNLKKTIGNSTPEAYSAYLSLFVDGTEQTSARISGSSMKVVLSNYNPGQTIKVVAYEENARTTVLASQESAVTIDGISGVSPFSLDLSNDSEPVACDYENKMKQEDVEVTIDATLKEGTTVLDSTSGWAIGATTTATNVTITEVSGTFKQFKFKISRKDDYTIDEITTVTVTASKTGETSISKLFKFIRLPGGEPNTRYYVEMSTSALKISKTGEYNPSELTVTAKKAVGSAMGVPITNSNLKMSIDGGTETPVSSTHTATITFGTTYQPTKNVRISAYTTSGSLIDSEEIPVVIDGEDGSPAVSHYILMPNSIGRKADGTYSPTSFEATLYRTVGGNIPSPAPNTTFLVLYVDGTEKKSGAGPNMSVQFGSGSGKYAPSSTIKIVAYEDNTRATELTTFEAPIITDGSKGDGGLSAAVVFLYQRSSTKPSTKPSGDLTYTFATGKLSGDATIFQGWQQTIPTDNNSPCYKIQASAISAEATDVIGSSEWSEIELYLKDGEKGDDGYNTAQVYLYKRSATAPEIDWTETLTYTFSSHSLSSVPSGWYVSIPSGDNPVYMTAAVANSKSKTDTIAPNEWATPVKLAENGQPGGPGDPGESTCTIILDNPNDSIPCTSAGTPTYTPAEWKSETQHTLKAFYGTEQKNFLVVKNSVPSGRTTGSYTIVYKLAGLGDESLFNLNGYVAGTEVSSWSPYLTGVTNKTTTVNYKLYNGQQEVASNKFWATKQIPGEDGAPAVDYKLTTSDGVTFKETGSGTTSVITPSSITINSQKSVDGTVTINPSETYYTTQYEGGSESAKVQFTSSGLVINNSDLATYNYVVIKLYVYNSTSSTYSYWESITLNKLKNGADGLGSYTMDLSNDFESVPCTSGGVILTNPYVAKTTPRIYYGNEEETGWTITPTVPTGITINPTTGTSGTEFTMSLTSFVAGTTGSDVVFTATATNKPTLAKTFVFSQLRGGEPGTRYYLECPIGTIGKNKSGAYTISSFTIVAKKSTGDSLGVKIDSAVFKVKKDNDSSTTVLTAQGEATITLGGEDTPAERAAGYFAPTSKLYIETYLPGGTVLMDKEEIPVVIDGTDGQPGSPGNPGSNTAVVFLYQRSSTAPTQKPNGNLTYTFATGKLSGSESTFQGWKQTIPTDTRFPCYKIQASAISTEATDTIASSEWSEIELFLKDGENGDPGYNTAQVYLYKRSATVATIDWTETLTYTFSTHSLNKTPSNWYTSIPSGTDPIYMTAAVANSRTDTDDIDYNEWAEPIKMAQNGENGSPGSPAVAYSVSMPSSIGRSANNGYNPSSFTAILYKTVGSASPVQQVAYLSLFIDGVEKTSARVDQSSTITVTLANYQPTQSVKIVAYSESARTTIIASSEASVNTVVTFDNVCSALGVTTSATSDNGLYWDGTNTKLLINATGIKTGILQVGDDSTGGIRFLANKDTDVVSVGGFDVSSNKLSVGTEGMSNSIILQSSGVSHLCYKSTNFVQTVYLSQSTLKISDNRQGTLTQNKKFSIYVRSQLNSQNYMVASIINPTPGSSGTGSKSDWFSNNTNVKQKVLGSSNTSYDLSNYTKIDYEFGTSGTDYIYIAFLKFSGIVEDSLGFILIPDDNELLVSETGYVASPEYYGFSREYAGDIYGGAQITVGQNFKVDSSGALYSTSGNIGGFTLTSNCLQNTDDGAGLVLTGTRGGVVITQGGMTASNAVLEESTIQNAKSISFDGVTGSLQGAPYSGMEYYDYTIGCSQSSTTSSTTLSPIGGCVRRGSSTTVANPVKQENMVATIVVKGNIPASGGTYTATVTSTATFNEGSYMLTFPPQTVSLVNVEIISTSISPSYVGIGTGAISISQNFVSAVNGGYDLGSSSNKWNNVWAVNSEIQTSDRKEKKEIKENLANYSNFFDMLKPVSYKFIENTSNRTHLGLISQEVEEALTESGLTSLDFAGFIKSPKDETKPEEERTDEDYTYGIRYGELHAMEIYEIQQLKTEIKALKKQLKEAKGE